jgi:hypothetical protein
MFEIKNKNVLTLLFILICCMLVNPFEKRTFTKTFEGKKNITTHMKEKGNKNIIIFKELQKDKYYFKNLEQYLLAQGICEVNEFYTNSAENDIKSKFTKVLVKNVSEITK